jgi:hypothetical protein
MKNLNIRTILLSVLAVIASVILIAMTYKLFKGYIPQIIFIAWRLWFNYQTYIRGIVANKYLSKYRVAGVIAAILIFEAVLTFVLWLGGFY